MIEVILVAIVFFLLSILGKKTEKGWERLGVVCNLKRASSFFIIFFFKFITVVRLFQNGYWCCLVLKDILLRSYFKSGLEFSI